ncbi:TPA: glycosyltransferase family 2 protein, partial [Yersinia enterocolitica]|nr:glycosyltransferase family 2 protein [Yersinia enterocolitica]
MTLVTIFTPTFNRSHVLKRCYLSILEQHRDDIEWLIIDDGSTDDTANIVKEFQNENKLKIKYIYQNNSGKQASWNRAVENAKGEYFIGVDSDDILATGSINNLLSIRDVFDDESIIGIRAISMNSNKMKPDSLYLYGRDDESSWFDEFRSGLRGERIDFFKTKILKK